MKMTGVVLTRVTRQPADSPAQEMYSFPFMRGGYWW